MIPCPAGDQEDFSHSEIRAYSGRYKHSLYMNKSRNSSVGKHTRRELGLDSSGLQGGSH